MSTDGIEMASITISRRYDLDAEHSDDSDRVTVEFSEDLTLVEILGLLEFAKMSAAADMIRDVPPDE